MKTLLEKFEKLQAKYQAKRDYFKKVIDGFKTKQNLKLYQKGKQLLEEADTLIQELKSDFSLTAEGSAHKTILKLKIKSFQEAYKELHEMTKPVWRQWTEAIVIALVLALVLRNFIFGLYHVPTGSAEKNILVGDRICGNKMAYFFSPVKHSDLVIFDNPYFEYDRFSWLQYLWQRYVGFPIPILGLGTGPDNWVKRVIAVPGDVIEGRVEDGKTVVYRNGKKLDEPYVNALPLIRIRKYPGFIPFNHLGPIAVPQFLTYRTELRDYTYDPSKPYDQQPYYLMNEHDVVRRLDGKGPELSHAFSPTYDHRTGVCMDIFGPYVVPPGKYWVMGDSRKNSIDSRWWLFLDRSLVHGRASFIIYSIDSEEAFWIFELIKHPIDFWTKHVRWNRFFKGLNGY